MANKIINESGYSQYNFNYEKTDLFQDLKKLFSTDVIIRDQGNGELKVIDINQIQSNGILQSNSLIDRFSKIYTTSGLGVYNSFNNYNFQALRAQLYLDYDAMDTDAIIHSALDIYADESVLKNEKNKNIKIISTNEEIKKELENLYYNIINVNFNLWFWIRNLVKYGDFFLKLELLERFGVYNVIPFTPYGIVREEGYDRRRPNAIRFKFDPTHIQGASSGFGIAAPYPYASNRSIYFENYEMVHLRLQGDINYLPYGTSILENGRKLFKQYVLIEDAALIHRIARSPEKRIYYINVGAIPPEEVDAYIQKMISNIKRTPLVDPKTGDYNLKYNMMNMLDDFFVPVRGNDVTTKIDTIKGLDYAGMEDIAYFREKLFAALKVPKAFMGYEKDLCIAPDTKIPLLNGRILTANEIIDEFNKGIKNYVYSIDETTKDIVPGEIEWAGFTRMNTKTIKVWLDNNQYIQCTPDHLFLTREGEWIEAQNLKEGQSLMPLYLKKSTTKRINGYNQVYIPSTKKYEFVHRVVSNYYNLKKNKDSVIHHKDFNKLNNNPENLDCSMNFWEHRKYHLDNINKTLLNPEKLKERSKNPKWLKAMSENGKKMGKFNSIKLVEWIKKNGASRKGCGIETIYNCSNCGCIIKHKKNEFNSQYKKLYCSNKCKLEGWKGKYNNINKEILIAAASQSNSFLELKNKLNIKDHATLRKLLLKYNFDKEQFILDYMPLAHSNAYFMNQFRKTNEYYKKSINYINHKVLKIEEVEELIDTCDLTIKDYHNFGTEAGVIIHNSGKSTLAAQDIRFARTIERIQAIVLSELKKIGLVHLYIKGFKTEELGNFDLSLTLPSIIYEQEQIALLKEKMELAKNMVADNYFSTDYIYENIFKMTQHEYFSMRDEIKEDLKRTFNNSQIKSEGNDNETSGQIFGTPHRLAKLYQQNADGSEAKKIPPGYGEKELNTYPLPGRPVSNTTILRTDDDPLTRDRLGRKDIEDTLNVRNDLDPKHNYKGKKVLSLEENIKPLNQQEIFLIEDLKYKTGKVGIIKESKQNKKVSYPKIKSILAESLDFDENREKVLTQQEINDIKNEGINILVESQQYNMEDNSDNILSKYEQKIFKD